MAITTQFLTGFEHGFVGSAATAGGGLFDVIAGTGFSASTTSPRNGSYCAHCVAPASTVVRVGKTVSGSKLIIRLAVKLSSRPSSGTCRIMHCVNSLGTTTFFITASSSGGLGIGAGGAVRTGPIIDTINWHLIELQIDSVSNIVDWKVDGVAMTQVSGGSAMGTLTTFYLGTDLASESAFTADYDDWIVGTWATAVTDWYGDGKVLGQVAGVDGTHATITSLSPGDAGTAYSGTPTNVNTMVDDPPATGGWTATRSATDNIALRVATVAAYAEVKPAVTAETGVANAVRAIMSYSASATQANLAACDVRNSAGVVTELWGLTGGVGKAYNIVANQFKGAIVTVPAASWTAAEVNAVRLRFGGCTSADISPVPTVQAIMLEVDWPVALGTTYNDTRSGAIAASGSGTEDYSHDASASGTITASGSGIESYSTPVAYDDSASGTIISSGAGTDNRVYDDSASGSITASGTGTDSRVSADSASGTITASGTGTDNRVYDDITVGAITTSGTGIESYSDIDSGSGTVTASGTSTESYSYADSSSGTATVTGSGTESYVLPPSAYAAVILADNPVGYWHLKDLTDSSGHNLTLTQSGTVTDVAGLVVSENGAKQFKTDYQVDGLSHVDDPWLQLGSAFTVEAWLNPVFMDAFFAVQKYHTYLLSMLPSGKFRIEFWTTGGFWQADSTTVAVLGNTYHVVGTFDGSNVRIYVNGTLEGTTAVIGTPINSATPFCIGADVGRNPGWWGVVDEVAIYQTVLTPTDNQEHYTIGSGSVAYNDSGAGTITASGTGVDARICTDSGSGTIITSGTGSDARICTDTSVGTITGSGIGTDSGVYNDTGIGTIAATGTGVDSSVYVDSGTGTVTANGVGTDARVYTDISTGTIVATGTSSDSSVYADNGAGTVVVTGAGVDAKSYTDSGSGTVTATGTGVDNSVYTDASAGTIAATGTSIDTDVYTDTGTGTIITTGTGTESISYTASATGTVTTSGSGVESAVHSASATGTIVVSGTGIDSKVYDDAVSGTALVSGTGVENYSVLVGYADANSGQINASGTSVESQSHTSTAIGAVLVDGTSVESQSHTSTATGSVLVNGTSVESYSHTSTATGFVFVDGTGSETHSVDTSINYTDSSEGIITSTGTGVDSVSYSDAAIGTVTSTGTSVDSAFYSNTETGTITLFGNGVESYSYTDASTGIIVVTGIGREFGISTQPVPFSTIIALNRFNVAVVNKAPIRSVVTSTTPLIVQVALQRTIKVEVAKRNEMKVLVTNR